MHNKASVFFITLTLSGASIGAMYGFGPAESWTNAQIAALSSKAVAEIGTFGSTFSAQLELKFEQIISAVAVATKQEALAGSIVVDSQNDSARMLMSTIKAQKEADRLAKAVVNYSGMGQGFDPCGTYAKNKTTAYVFENASQVAASNLKQMDLSPGKMVDSKSAALEQRMKAHKTYFCTSTEADAGSCTVSKLPGGDSNAALLFSPADQNSLNHKAQDGFIQHVLGMPNQKIAPDAGKTPAGEAYLIAKNRKDSLNSIPALSLKTIQAANLRDPNAGNLSPNEILTMRVNQYFGGSEAKTWSGSLAAQTNRGLLVELLKVAGLESWMNLKEYETNQRLEANLAALLIAESQSAQSDLARSEVVRQNAAAAIR